MTESIKVQPLIVFNASAGSGKTYQLVKEYIKMLISGETDSHQFSHILAMTFTNKAALEMKQRIISALDEISNSDSKKGLVKELSEESGVSEKIVEERCSKVLTQILHRYEDFHVMTIDKFNLRLIKSFSRELELPPEFEVVMNEVEMIEKIVDELLSKLGTSGAEELNRLILTYAKNNVDEGSRWNFRSDLIKFGQILNKEQNKRIVDRLLEMDFSLEKHRALYLQKNTIDKKYRELAEKLAAVMRDNGVQSDLLPGKSRTYNAIMKLVKAENMPTDDPVIGKALSASLEKELKKGEFFPEVLKKQIHKIEKFCDEQRKDYILLQLVLKNFFNMALLQHMAKEITKVRAEEQLIRISEFNTMISDLIRNENALYIYERLGNRFYHYLLDEFQDTSRLQWLNLVPLVKDSLGNNRANLIVGDPKQSIYRFKNGVAEQFVELPGLYNPEKIKEIAEDSAYFKQMGQVLPLKFNWRSAKNIVEFNNSFFNRLKSFLSGNTVSFYNSVDQIPKSTFDGRIRIESKEEKIDADALVNHIENSILECRADGFQMNDICVLGSTNKHCNYWAIELTKRGYKVVSADSLLIQSDLHVQLTIAYLYCRLHPHGQNEMKRFAELYFRSKKDAVVGDYLNYIIEEAHGNDSSRVSRRFDHASFLRNHFSGSDTFFCSFEGLYDLIQKFYRLAGLNEMENAYLHRLADFSFEFSLKKGPDLQHFLEEFERSKGEIAVQVPESPEAIQIMTMHKAKGLEFPVVILPSMDFKLDVKGSFLVDIDDFIIYKNPVKNEPIAILQELHDKEKEQVMVDAMNLCYVAMTRPEHRLYVYNHFEKGKFGALFHEALDTIEEVEEIDGVKRVDIVPDQERPLSHRKDENIHFSPEELSDKLWFPDIALQDDERAFEEDHLSAERSYGRQFHLLISRIKTEEEIIDAIKEGIDSGEVDLEFKSKLEKQLKQTITSASYKELFKEAQKIMNEQSIIVSGREVQRPDKIICKNEETIIIDYKTGRPSSLNDKNRKYIKQVSAYKAILEEMGFPNVSGYLFYISDLSLEKVY